MTSDGSPYARFQRALRIGRLSMVRAAAAELPHVELDDALSICLLMSEQDSERYERAAVRWLARLSLEVPSVRIEDLRAGLLAFEALREWVDRHRPRYVLHGHTHPLPGRTLTRYGDTKVHWISGARVLDLH